MISTRATVLFLALGLLATPPVAANGDELLGLWNTQPEEYGYARVDVTKQNDRYRGQIVWLSQPEFPADDDGGMGGQPKIDRENPEPDLRDRPIVGVRLLENFKYAGKSQWKGGTIYDPANGKTYRCNIKLQDDGTLKVRGYIGVPMLGRTAIWSRWNDAER
jgi:uncharacterized protein (DUF2147 family)